MPSIINSNTSSGLVTSGSTDGVLQLQTASTTAVTIDASQNVGVGTSSPATKLDVNGDVTQRNGGGTTIGKIWNDGGLYSIAADSANVLGLKLNAAGSQYISSWTNGSERMRIDSSGNLLVGQTSKSATTVGFYVSPSGEVSGCLAASTNASTQWNTYSTGAGAYRFYVGMSGTVFATSTSISAISDQRFKENIRDLDAGLTEVMALKPRLYDWKKGKGADIKNARGFIAQEFEEVFPDLIDEWRDPAPEGEDPYKSVRQDLIPVLVKAIQELSAQVTELKAEVQALKGA